MILIIQVVTGGSTPESGEGCGGDVLSAAAAAATTTSSSGAPTQERSGARTYGNVLRDRCRDRARAPSFLFFVCTAHISARPHYCFFSATFIRRAGLLLKA
jgi:hypothetical protein